VITKTSAVLLLTVALAAPSALAQEAELTDEGRMSLAETLFQEGLEALRASRFDEGIELLDRSIALYPRFSARFNRAVGLRRAGRPLQAARALEELLDEAPDATIDERARVREEIARTYAELAEIRIRAEAIGATEVSVDGEPAGAASERPLVVHAMPGAHEIAATTESRTCEPHRIEGRAGSAIEVVFDASRCELHARPTVEENDDPWVWVAILSASGAVLLGGAIALAVWLGNREGELVTDPINGIEFVLRF
jgi:hypothetical protein